MPANSEQVLAITGSSFEYGATVKFGAYRLPTTFVTGNLIDVDIPAADNPALANYPGSVSIIVYNPAGTPSTSVMEGLTQPLPVITSISPSSVPAGRAFVLTINGYNFGQGSQVYLNGVGKSTTRLSSTQVSATILGSAIPTAGAANIQVQVPGAPGPSNTVQITVYLSPAI